MADIYIVRADLVRADLRRDYRSDLPDQAVAYMADALDLVLSGSPAEVPGRPGYWMTGANAHRALTVTLFRGRPPEAVPMCTIAICKRSRDSARLWRLMHDGQDGLLTRADDPPAVPWLAERVEVGALLNMDAMRWSGSWARALAWAWMEYDQ